MSTFITLITAAAAADVNRTGEEARRLYMCNRDETKSHVLEPNKHKTLLM